MNRLPVWRERSRRARGAGRRRLFSIEQLEQRQLLAIWQNPLHPLDVSDDGFIAPLDAVLVINEINGGGLGELPHTIGLTSPYFDTSGDGILAALDAVLVINALNAGVIVSDIELGLVNDTGRSNSDRITSDVVTAGHVPLHFVPGTLIGRFDRNEVFPITTDASGNFVLDPVGGDEESFPDGLLKVGVSYALPDGRQVLRQLAVTLDREAPELAAQLGLTAATDTGSSSTDRITRLVRPTLRAVVEPAATVEFVIDGAAVGSSVADAAGIAVLPLTQDLSEGMHALRARVTDAAGNAGALSGSFSLQVDLTPPGAPAVQLSRTSDTGASGDLTTQLPRVTLVGTAEPGLAILLNGQAVSLADGAGNFQIPGVALTEGNNALLVQASDVAGNLAAQSVSIVLDTSAALSDPVLDWNQTALETIRMEGATPLTASRALAMVHVAMLDALAAIDGTPGFLVRLAAPAGAAPEAALAAAAHRVLEYLFPRQAAALNGVLTTRLTPIPDGASKTAGIDFGRAIAQAVIDVRQTDGWDDFVDFPSSTTPGQWRITAPMYEVALAPQWADMTPFALTSPDQFRPPGPPALNSAEYAASYNEVKAIGASSGSTRTPEQTQIARFWADGPGTYTPPGHWNQIAAELALQNDTGLLASARLFAMLNVALADAGIAAWDAKYHYNFWRPISAVQEGALDSNAATAADAQWTSLILSPPFPEYVSGHSTFSAAAAEILSDYFGDQVPFSTTSVGLPAVVRNFASFRDAAAEAGRSRIYGGIHFEFSNQDGQATGRSVAQQTLAAFSTTVDTMPPAIVITSAAPGQAVAGNVTVQGRVLDNLSGVALLTATLDGVDTAPINVNAAGEFSLTSNLLLTGVDDGLHVFQLQAIDHAGQQATLEYSFVLDTQAPTIAIATPVAAAEISTGARLTGTASGTASALVQLTYQVDGGAPQSLPFDDSGAFDQLLDVWNLNAGLHSLTITARDATGWSATQHRTFSVAADGPLRVAAISPADGSHEIGVTYRPQVFFSRPVDRNTLTCQNFYAVTAGGTRIPATIVPAQDGRFAWLMFHDPLPGGTSIRLHVNGATIRDLGGAPLDADGDGIAGGELVTSFTTVSLTPLPGTSLVGRVVDPGADLAPMTFDDLRAGPDGALHTPDDVFLSSIAHAHVYVLGREADAVFTAADGRFTLPNMPAGNVKLVIDGRTATNAPVGIFWPEMVMDLYIEAGGVNTVMGTMGLREEREANLDRTEVYLPRIELAALTPVSDIAITEVTVDGRSAPNLSPEQQAQLKLFVQPNSVIGEDGLPVDDPLVGISTVPPQLVRDMLPPGVLQHTFDITIQAPDAAVFNTPLQISFPNVFNAAPGRQLSFLSFDHTTGRLVIEGTATVSADGLSVVTDPGTGITKPGWHGVTDEGGCGDTPPPPPPDREKDEPRPGDTEDEPRKVPGGLHVIGKEDGGQGEEGGDAIFLTFHGPPKEDSEQQPQPSGGGGGECSAPPPPPKKDPQVEPKVHVEIKIDGPALTFLKVNGDSTLPLVSASFDVPKGEKKVLSVSFKKPEDIPGLLKSEDNILFGSTVEVTITTTHSDGSRHKQKTTYYQHALWDGTDDNGTPAAQPKKNPSDSTLSFEKTLPGVTREKAILLNTGTIARRITSQGPDFNVEFQGEHAVIKLTPHNAVQQLTNLTGTLTISVRDDENTLVGDVQLSGVAGPRQDVFVDTDAFALGIKNAYDRGLMTPIERAMFEVGGVFSLGKASQLVDQVVTRLTARLEDYQEGIRVITGGSTSNSVLIDDFVYDSSGRDNPTWRNIEQFCRTIGKPKNIIANIMGESGAIDIDQEAAKAILARWFGGNATTSETVYGLSHYMQNDYHGWIANYVPSFFTFNGKSNHWTETTLVNTMTMNISHELGHQLGLLHTDGFDGTPRTSIMSSGIDPSGVRNFDLIGEAIKLALGLEWSALVDGKKALDYVHNTLIKPPPSPPNFFALCDSGGSRANTMLDPPIDFDSTGFEIGRGLAGILYPDRGIVRNAAFGAVTIGESPVQTLVVHNIGDRPVNVTHFYVDSPTGQFTIAGLGERFTLDANERRTFTLQFAAQSAGRDEATLVMLSDGLYGDLRIPVSAAAHASGPALGIVKVNNNLGGQYVGDPAVTTSAAFVLANNGLEPLAISRIELSEQLGPFTLLGVPSNLETTPLMLAPGEQFSFGASFAPRQVGLQRVFVRIETNDAARPVQTLSLVATGLPDLVYPHWGSDYVAIASPETPSLPPLHMISQPNGNFDVFLAAERLYHEVIFDPVTGLVAHGYGRTARSGFSTNLTSSLVFGASTEPDADFDGLPDDVEFAVGTAAVRADSDADGLDDFAEVMQGLDPLSSRNPPVGIIGAVALLGMTMDVGVAAAPADPTQRIAYLATGDHGVATVDVTDVTAPIVLSQIELSGFSQAIALDTQRQLAVVAGFMGGLHILDVADPRLPALLKTVRFMQDVKSVETFDGVAFAIVGHELISIDLSTFEILQTLPLPNLLSLAREGDKLYALSPGTLRVIDLGGYGMTLRGSVPVPFVVDNRRNLFVADDIAYVMMSTLGPTLSVGGYGTFDVSDPDQPVLIGAPDTPEGVFAPITGLTPNGSGLGLLFDSIARVVDVWDIADLQQTYLPGARFTLETSPFEVASVGGYGIIAAGFGGLQTLNYGGYDVQGIAPTISLTTRAVDVDAITAGLQIYEGERVTLRAVVLDDVRVQDVQWIVDGRTLESDFSYPWDLSLRAPLLAAGATSFVVEARATDIGGNTRLSTPLVIGITADTSAGPTVVAAQPAEGAQLAALSAIRVDFSKPLDFAALDPAGVTLTYLGPNGVVGGGDDVLIPLRPLELRNFDRTLQIVADGTIPAGAYQLRILPSSIKDLRGLELDATLTRNFSQAGEILPGQLASGNIAVAGQVDVYRLMGSLGQRLLLDSLDDDSQNVFIRLVSPSGMTIWDRFINDLEPITLAESGAYQVSIYGPGNATGDYHFRLLEAAAAPLVALGSPLTGTLAPEQRIDLYRVMGQAGERVVVDHFGPRNFDFQVTIYSPGNLPLFSGAVLPVDGEYLVAVASAFASGPIDYNFALVAPGDSTNPIALNQVVSGAIGQPGERDSYTFVGAPGQMLYFDALGTSQQALELEITGPTGKRIRSATFAGVAFDASPLVLHAAGIHTLTITSDELTGTYRFRLLDVDTLPALSLNTPTSGTRPAQEAVVFAFSATAGQALHLANLAPGIEFNAAEYRLFGPGGALVGDWPFHGTSDNTTVVPPVAGRYFLVITGAADHGTYNFSFRLDTPQITTAPLTLGSEASGTLSSRGDVRTYTFEATAGQSLYFDNLDNTGNTRRLIAPSGAELFRGTTGFANSGPLRLGETGTYRFEIRPLFNFGWVDTPSDFRFRILDPDASASELAPGVPTTATFTLGAESRFYRFSGNAHDQITLAQQSQSRGTTPSERWTIIDPAGRPLASRQLGLELVANLPETGTYLLVLAAGSTQPLEMNFQLARVAGSPVTPSGLGDARSGTIAAGQQQILNFTASAGTLLYIDLLTGNTGNLTSSLRDPADVSLATVPVSAFAGDPAPLLLGRSGVYSFRVPNFAGGSQSGNYHLKFVDVAASATALEWGETLAGTIPARETRFFKITAVAGQTAYFQQLQEFADAALVLPDGRVVELDDSLISLAAGDYYLMLRSSETTSESYQFRLLDAAAAPLESLAVSVTGTLAADSAIALHRFELTAGDVIALDTLVPDDFQTEILVYGPDGERLLTGSFPVSSEFKVASSGTHYVVVRNEAAVDPVDYEFVLRNVVAATTAVAIGDLFSGTTASFSEQQHFTFAASAGQRLYIDGLAHDHRLRLLSPSGVDLSADAHHPGTLLGNPQDLLPFPLVESGTYTLVVEEGIGDFSGRIVETTSPPVLAIDSDATAHFNPLGQAAIYQFTAAAGQRLYFDNRSSQAVPVQIVDAAGHSLAPGSFDFTFTIPSDGDYLLIISQSPVASVPFQLSTITDDIRPIEFGTLYDGEIDAPGKRGIYTFAGELGQRIVLDWLNLDFAGGQEVLLKSPSGATVLQTTSNVAAQRPLTLLENGEYRLEIGGADKLGPFEFQIFDVATAPLLPRETPVTGTLTPGTRDTFYSYVGAAGERIYLDATTFSSISGSWYVLGPGNQILASVQFSNDMEVLFPAAGTYLLQLAAQITAPINYNFTLYSPAQSVQPLVLDAPIAGTLDQPGERDVYTFTVGAGERFYYDAHDGPGAAFTVRIENASGALVAGSSGDARTDRAPFTIATAGEYRLIIDGTGAALGSYNFRLASVAGAAVAPIGAPIGATLDPGRAADVYRFEGAAGQALLFDMQSASSTQGTWFLYGPNNQLFKSAALGSDFSHTLPGAGTYVIVVAGNLDSPINYQFQISPALLAAPGERSSTTTAAPSQAELDRLLAAAVAQFLALDLNDHQRSVLNCVGIAARKLDGAMLGAASNDTVWIDTDAAGWGWFIDPTPESADEFDSDATLEEFDLLTVIAHELAHLLGHDHEDEGLLAPALAPGVRKSISN